VKYEIVWQTKIRPVPVPTVLHSTQPTLKLGWE